VTSTELSYLDNVTSSIQTQLNNKASTTPELMVSTPVTANAGSTAVVSLNLQTNFNTKPKIKVYWKPTGIYGYYSNEFLLEAESYQKPVSGFAHGYNVDNSRWEFYTVNFVFFSSENTVGAVDRITIQNGRRWHLDGSFSNEEDITAIQVTVLSVTYSAR
jgi:hypothetical protein